MPKYMLDIDRVRIFSMGEHIIAKLKLKVVRAPKTKIKII